MWGRKVFGGVPDTFKVVLEYGPATQEWHHHGPGGTTAAKPPSSRPQTAQHVRLPVAVATLEFEFNSEEPEALIIERFAQRRSMLLLDRLEESIVVDVTPAGADKRTTANAGNDSVAAAGGLPHACRAGSLLGRSQHQQQLEAQQLQAQQQQAHLHALRPAAMPKPKTPRAGLSSLQAVGSITSAARFSAGEYDSDSLGGEEELEDAAASYAADAATFEAASLPTAAAAAADRAISAGGSGAGAVATLSNLGIESRERSSPGDETTADTEPSRPLRVRLSLSGSMPTLRTIQVSRTNGSAGFAPEPLLAALFKHCDLTGVWKVKGAEGFGNFWSSCVEVTQWESLRNLNLCYCALTTLPSAVGSLPRLRILRVSHNRLTALPADVQHLTELEVLAADNNQLTAVPAELKRCSQLREINLDGNKLTTFLLDLRGMLLLQSLQLYGNPLEYLPELSPCEQLRSLSLVNVRILADSTYSRWEVEVGNISYMARGHKLSPLFRLTFRRSSAQHPLLAGALGRIAEDRTNCELIAKEEAAIQQLLLMSLSENPVVVRQACKTIGHLAALDAATAKRLVSNDVLSAVMTLMRSRTNESSQLCGLNVLSSLAGGSDTASVELLSPSLLQLLQHLIQEGAPAVKAAALESLSVLAFARENKLKVRQARGLLQLVVHLAQPAPGGHSTAGTPSHRRQAKAAVEAAAAAAAAARRGEATPVLQAAPAVPLTSGTGSSSSAGGAAAAAVGGLPPAAEAAAAAAAVASASAAPPQQPPRPSSASGTAAMRPMVGSAVAAVAVTAATAAMNVLQPRGPSVTPTVFLEPAPPPSEAVEEASSSVAALGGSPQAIRLLALRVLAVLGENEQVRMALRLDSLAGRGVRILSMDGGGMKGLAMVQMLRHIERFTGKPIHALFDLIVGTSTGAILAVGAGTLKYTLDQCEAIYTKLGQKVFNQQIAPAGGKDDGAASWRDSWYKVYKGTSQNLRAAVYGSKHDPSTYQGLLKEICEMPQWGCVTDQFIDSVCLGGPKVAVIATLASTTPARPFAFRNYEFNVEALAQGDHIHACEGSSRHLVWQAVRASSAAPYYLDEFVCGEERFQDGAATANNPAVIAVQQARLLWPDRPLDIVVSLGTGCPPSAKREAPSHRHMLTASVLIESACNVERADEALAALLPLIPGSRYYRFQPVDERCGMELDDVDPASWARLQTAVEEFCLAHGAAFKELSALLSPQQDEAQLEGDGDDDDVVELLEEEEEGDGEAEGERLGAEQSVTPVSRGRSLDAERTPGRNSRQGLMAAVRRKRVGVEARASEAALGRPMSAASKLKLGPRKGLLLLEAPCPLRIRYASMTERVADVAAAQPHLLRRCNFAKEASGHPASASDVGNDRSASGSGRSAPTFPDSSAWHQQDPRFHMHSNTASTPWATSVDAKRAGWTLGSRVGAEPLAGSNSERARQVLSNIADPVLLSDSDAKFTLQPHLAPGTNLSVPRGAGDVGTTTAAAMAAAAAAAAAQEPGSRSAPVSRGPSRTNSDLAVAAAAGSRPPALPHKPPPQHGSSGGAAPHVHQSVSQLQLHGSMQNSPDSRMQPSLPSSVLQPGKGGADVLSPPRPASDGGAGSEASRALSPYTSADAAQSSLLNYFFPSRRTPPAPGTASSDGRNSSAGAAPDGGPLSPTVAASAGQAAAFSVGSPPLSPHQHQQQQWKASKASQNISSHALPSSVAVPPSTSTAGLQSTARGTAAATEVGSGGSSSLWSLLSLGGGSAASAASAATTAAAAQQQQEQQQIAASATEDASAPSLEGREPSLAVHLTQPHLPHSVVNPRAAAAAATSAHGSPAVAIHVEPADLLRGLLEDLGQQLGIVHLAMQSTHDPPSYDAQHKPSLPPDVHSNVSGGSHGNVPEGLVAGWVQDVVALVGGSAEERQLIRRLGHDPSSIQSLGQLLDGQALLQVADNSLDYYSQLSRTELQLPGGMRVVSYLLQRTRPSVVLGAQEVLSMMGEWGSSILVSATPLPPSFVDGLLRCGVAAVIAPLTALGSSPAMQHAAVMFFSALYSAMYKGKSVAAALVAAERQCPELAGLVSCSAS